MEFATHGMELSYVCYEPPSGKTNQDSKPIIFLHGAIGTKEEWHCFAKELVKTIDTKIYTLDARNHGESPTSEGHKIQDMVLDVIRFLGLNNIEAATFIGHSMGGRVAMTLALEKPELVDKLVIVDSKPISNTKEDFSRMKNLMKTLRDILNNLSKSLSYEDACDIADKMLSKDIAQDVVRSSIIERNLLRADDGSYNWRMNLNALEKRNIGYLSFPAGDYSGKTLFIFGKKSEKFSDSLNEDCKEIFPNAELKFVEEAGHWLHLEKPKEFMSILVGFLSDDRK